MHLERVTTRSSEAGLAGWIASNDVTLFTVVLVMAVALFLHSRVTRGAREQTLLADRNAAVAATLSATESELDDARDLLERTNQTLRLTQTERDQLQAQLVEKLAAMTELNVKLDALLADKSELSRQRQQLLAEKQALAAEKLTVEGARDAAASDNATLRTRLDLLSSQLTEKIAALEETIAQRDRLTAQADELASIVAALKQRLDELDVDYQTAQQDAAAAEAAAAANVKQLEAKVAAGNLRAESYLADLRRAAAMMESLQLEKRHLQNELTAAERQRQANLLAEAENNRKLVGLKGSLRNVAVLFDASGSMRQTGDGGADRWTEAQAIAATWLKHLNVEQCVLIVYSNDVQSFPRDGTLADLRGAAGAAKREQLLRQVESIEPGGWTDTLAAFQKAYEYDVDTILLLSDGAPSKVSTGVFQEELARQIYDLCRQHPNVTVNTIGLGNYFDREMGTFLRTVAQMTGGEFRGE